MERRSGGPTRVSFAFVDKRSKPLLMKLADLGFTSLTATVERLIHKEANALGLTVDDGEQPVKRFTGRGTYHRESTDAAA